MDSSKTKQKGQEEQGRRRREPETQEQKLEKVEIKTSEKARLEVVYSLLNTRQNELSSDEDSKEKKYKKKIEEKANAKKMKVETSNFVSKTAMSQSIKMSPTKKFKEDNNKENNAAEKKKSKKGFGVKALRKTIRNLCDEYSKDELEQMVWDCDDDMDGLISENEFHRMYKKCIVDENEEEPKKLFYLIQFLMYDKEEKNHITIEDTLEILCVRHPNNIDAAINNIFDEEIPDPKGNKRGKQYETLTYIQYAKRMHQLSLIKRTELSNRKKLFCNKIKEEAIKAQREKY